MSRAFRLCVIFVVGALMIFAALANACAQEEQQQQLVPRYIALPPAHPVDVEAYQASGTGLTSWTGTFTNLGTTYTYTMLGTDPSKGSASTTINFVLIPLAVKFPGGITLDPTRQVQSGCGTGTPLNITRNSPLLLHINWTQGGTNVGTTQYIDAFQRAEFWNFVGTTAKNYHVFLGKPTVTAKQTLDATTTGSTATGGCGIYGQLDINVFDAAVQSIITSLNLAPNQFPYFVTYDVFQTQGGSCCVLGYHSITPNNVVYGTGSYNDQDIFAGPPNAFLDLVTMSHEIGETVNDPFVNNFNAVPNWVSPYAPQYGCNNALEVGDPLAGLPEGPYMVGTNPHKYYVQDLAFLPWFEQTATSTSVNGWFSMFGTFRAPAGTC
jgi:hypothetical protein